MQRQRLVSTLTITALWLVVTPIAGRVLFGKTMSSGVVSTAVGGLVFAALWYALYPTIAHARRDRE